MAVSFAGTELMVAIAHVSRQRAYRSERCRRPTSRAMTGSTARLSPQTRHSDARLSLASRQAGRGADPQYRAACVERSAAMAARICRNRLRDTKTLLFG